MSTYLQLLQQLHRDCGAAGTEPQAVTGLTGEAKRLADSARGVARDPAAVDSLAETCDRAAGIILSPEILNDPQRLDALLETLETSQVLGI